MSSQPDCLFCRIVAGEVPADVVHDGVHTLAFRDVAPQAPTHVLVVPRRHVENAVALAQAEPDALLELYDVVAGIASGAGLTDYRLVFNTGAQAGQSVFHAHGHLLGGRPMGWPPG